MSTQFNFSTVPSTPLRTQPLCTKCLAIDLAAAFQMDVTRNLGNLVTADFQTYNTDELSCQMCRFLRSIAPLVAESLDSCHLRAFSSNRVFTHRSKKGPDDTDRILLGLVPVNVAIANSGKDDALIEIRESLQQTGYLAALGGSTENEDFEVKRIVMDKFDVDFAKRCLEYCSQNHGKACHQKIQRKLFAMRVIDCSLRRVIAAPDDCRYVALSYVWGNSSSPNAEDGLRFEGNSLDGKKVKVINDSIEVTLRLGFQYLWVDRYCIDQQDELDQHHQVGQMDLIYANAQMTIIAAAGEGPEYGLPGVNGTLRKAQPKLTLEELSMVSTLPDSHWAVSNSKWATRGWTYQEGILSRRRLIFTDYQLYFECNGMHCTEGVSLPLDKMHYKDKRCFKSSIPKGLFNKTIVGSEPWSIGSFISEFSMREFSFTGDAVKAMQGIFNTFQTGRYPVYHYQGIPILTSIVTGKGKSIIGRKSPEGFLIGLSWTLRRPAPRNMSFPTWSWAGRLGPINEKLLYDSRWNFIMEGNVWIETVRGDIIAFPKYQHLTAVLPEISLHYKTLHIKTYIVPCSLVYFKGDFKTPPEGNGAPIQGYLLRLKLADETFRFVRLLKLDDELKNFGQVHSDPDGERLSLLFLNDLGNDWRWSGSGAPTLIALVTKRNGEFEERAGITKFLMLRKLVGEKWEFVSYQTGVELLKDIGVRRIVKLK